MTAIRNVLLVEDDANDVRLTIRYLERSGQALHVHVVNSIAEAQSFIGESEATLSLVLLDHMLPGGSGLEVLQSIRSSAAFRMVPVVMLTGNSDGTIVQRALREGVNSCVLKPIDPEDYERTISSIAEFWLGTNLLARPADLAAAS